MLAANGTVVAARVRDTMTGEESVLPSPDLFMAIGHDPRSELVRGQVDVDDEGYVQGAYAATTHTNLAGVFAAGDLVDHTYRQAVTAAGSGCAAAIDAERWLAEHAEHSRRPSCDGRPPSTELDPADRTHEQERTMAGNTVTVTDKSFDRRRAHQREAGAGRLLGDLVRPVQDGRAGAGGDRRPSTPTRSPSPSWTSTPTRRSPAEYQIMSMPTMIAVPGRQAGEADRRRQAEGRAAARPLRGAAEHAGGNSVPSVNERDHRSSPRPDWSGPYPCRRP